MFFDAKRPDVGEGAVFAAIEEEVLGEGQELPEGREPLPLHKR
jgi:hypothetical protein